MLDSEQYLLEFLETKEMDRNTSVFRTEDETAACFFWNSSSPTFLWNRAALDLSAGEDAELSAHARLMATLNLAIADALISAIWLSHPSASRGDGCCKLSRKKSRLVRY